MKLLILILLWFNFAQRDSAEQCLRQTREQDKMYVCPSSDSVIRYAVDYYDKHGSKAERTEAHYLLGCVEADLFNRAKAIYELRYAARLNPDKTGNQQALIYSRLGYLLYEHQLTEEAEEVYEKAEALARVRKDTTDLVHALMQRGNIRLSRGETDSAVTYIDEAWQLSETQHDNYLQATVLTAVYALCRQQGESTRAEWAARRCMSIVPHPMRTWPAMFNLGETLYYKEQYDSAKVLLEPILEIDHSYQLRADVADILEKIAIAEGNADAQRRYSELQKALERSARMSMETTAVLRQELEELELQAEKRHQTEVVLWLLLSLLVFLLAGIALMTILRFRRKQTLSQQIDNMQTERQSLIQEKFSSSEVYQKLQRLTELARENPYAKENLTAADWQQLMVYTDNMHNGIMTHLRSRYGLSEDELRICLMFILNVPVICMGYFVKGYSRNTIQLKARQIPVNAGAEKGTLLRDWLRDEEEVMEK